METEGKKITVPKINLNSMKKPVDPEFEQIKTLREESLHETKNSIDREYGSLLLNNKMSRVKTNNYEHKAAKNLIINTILEPN